MTRARLSSVFLAAGFGSLATGCAGTSRLEPATGTQPFLSAAAMAPASAGQALTVTTAGDSGKGCLRSVVAAAKSGATIRFALKRGATITLTHGPIAVSKSLVIAGPGATALSVSGGGRSQLFTIAKRVRVTISGLTLTKGAATQGGAVSNAGALTLANDVLTRNLAQTSGKAASAPLGVRVRFDPRPRARGGRPGKHPDVSRISEPKVTAAMGLGGAVYNAATLAVSASSFTVNSAQQGSGGAIYNGPGARLAVSGSTFQRNEAAVGGAVYNGGAAGMQTDRFESNVGWPGSGAPISGAFGYGSAIYVRGSTGVSNCTFSGNVAGGNTQASVGVGGAIAQFAGALSIVRSTFTSNVAGGGAHGSWGTGGALYSTAGKLTLTSDSFTNNRAGGDGYGYGGAVYADQAFSGTGNTFTQNVAYGNSSSGYAYGGAVYAGAGLHLSGGTFSRNSALAGGSANAGYAFGGAIDTESSSTLGSVTFSANSASGGSGGSAEAGGVYVAGGSSTWTSTTFSSNSATAAGASSYASGGAIVAFAPLSIAGTTALTSNTATAAASGAIAAAGGAVAVEVGPFSFVGTATKNSAGTQGGAFWIDDVATISNSLISDNSVLGVQNPNDGGGGIYVGLGGSLALTGSTLTANVTAGTQASTGGGGIFNEGSGSILNSTILGNTSSVDGGGVDNESTATFSLVNVTLYQNVAGGQGGNVKNLFADSTMSLANTIVAGGSAAGSGSDVSNDGTIVSGDYNVVQTAPSGNALTGTTTHDVAANPQLAPLAQNGGPTPTAADGSQSPGRAYIPFGVCQTAGILTDQRGYSRDPGGDGRCDVGAYEDQTP